jgi:hypothetical protein
VGGKATWEDGLDVPLREDEEAAAGCKQARKRATASTATTRRDLVAAAAG